MDAAAHFVVLCRTLRRLDVELPTVTGVDDALRIARTFDELESTVAKIAPGGWDAADALGRRLDALVRTAAHPDSQAVYEEAAQAFFASMDELERTLDTRRYVNPQGHPGPEDWWWFVHLVRFESVYYGLFKLNLRRLVDYPNVYAFTRDLFQMSGVAETFDRARVIESMYLAHPELEPKGVPPRGRGPDLWRPHDRAARFGGVGSTRGTEEDPNVVRQPGEWVRKTSAHRHWITRDGSSGFLGEPGRYHLYVANNCPWSHRTALARSMKGLEDVVSMDVLFYRRDAERGWQFKPEEDGCTSDRLFGSKFMTDVYERVGSTERSVPVLFDRVSETIVSNESADIIRMFDDAFSDHVDSSLVLYPEPLRDEIDRINAWTYVTINNGAYKAGFTSSREAYEEAYERFFEAFDELNRRLATTKYLVSDAPTEADLRLFPTIYRFDPVYYTRFRLNRMMVRDAPHLHRWLNDMLAFPGVLAASNLEHCRRGYFGRTGNSIVPLGPIAPHG